MPSVTPVEGQPNLIIGAYDLADLGYAAQEYFVSGTASSYAGEGAQADYTTRVVALTPIDVEKFNGTAMVEWLNVSGGVDAPAVWLMAHREIVREGYAYVCVSAQQVGVQGGMSLVGDFSLKTQNPQRYSQLHHPGDAYSYDMFSQVGALVRDGDEVLGRLKPKYVVAVGESQSAMYLTTYINSVDRLANVFDGFLVHSRFGGSAPLDGTNTLEAMAGGLKDPAPFRDDLRVPVMSVITETDVVGAILPGYYVARQQDTEHLRTWEIAGTSHADAYTIAVGFIDSGATPMEQIAAAYTPTDTLMGQQLDHCINFAPQHHYVLQAALNGLHEWVRTGTPPPSAPRLEVGDEDPPPLVRDEHGIAEGGLRTPWVDVPVAVTSGEVGDATEQPIALLFGTGERFDEHTRDELYPGGKNEYLARFTDSLDATIRAGYLLRADRDEILALAAATY
ncbi:hypothetical protein CQY20_16280 [Mycolicibacterium agri]|uniref:Alpha/beta hydrolase domain-containing protein n=1 Tax=Mycolicibacterium agri TaxID=36811 RepID=A0A2A7N1N1_MYCAG|nr:alpha/beta hydrolase domain-containing protein [Mycolicibacterium agri]PEG37338.1 hypothetical protein CQY20_16280 [Mycolicibacterium agri]GFG52406.1 hypothetical protein MAGR_38470 [Mycolicibacterium agri]